MDIMKFISPYIFQSYLTCLREAWLEYHGILSDQEHELLALGRLVHESSYQRARKEIFIDQLLKIDLFHNKMVAEVKKSSRHKEAARLQLAYYLYYLKHEKGIEMKGILLFPKERKTEHLTLTAELEERINQLIEEMLHVFSSETPPPVKKSKYCRTCSFQEVCWG